MNRAEILKAIKQNEAVRDKLDKKVKRSNDLDEKETLLYEIKRLEYQILKYKDLLKRLDMN